MRLARRLVAVAVFGLFAAAPGVGQVFRVVTFGDSLTEAIPFDLGSSRCAAGAPDTCGYTARLADAYGCGAGNCSFSNRGVSGELTLAGLSRVDQVLREREWDLMILLEGTNDIAGGISPQSVLFNLQEMADKARARGVGVVHAAPIWLNPSVEKESTPARNNAMRNLRGLLDRQAATIRACFADGFSQLCPEGPSQAACFASNYWAPPAGVVDFVGHPNSRGYDILGNEFFRVLGSFGPPGAAQPLSPTEEACGELLELTWAEETQARPGCGNWFQIQVDGPGGTRFDGWFPQDFACRGGGECSATVAANLRDGSHSFRVRTRNTAGYGPWSADQSFTSVASAPRQIRKLRGPAGELFIAGGGLEFLWKPEATAIEYRLEVVSPTAGVVIDEVLSPADHCDDAGCAYTPEGGIGAGRYSWRVRAENVCGGTWSEASLFTLYDSAPATAPETLSPAGRSFDSSPLLRWRPVAGASEYEIEDGLGNRVVLTADVACAGDTCRYLSPLLAPGLYDWRVRARSPLGEGVWSGLMGFQVAACNCLEGKAAGGSTYLIAVPENWNGDLVLWAQGSNPFGTREVEELSPLAQSQFDEGYAVAATSFTVTGWPMFRSERDLAKLYSIFERQVGRPDNVLLVGRSTGALAALTAAGSAKIGNVTGALTMCGPLAGSRNWEAALDLRLAYDAICAEVAGAAIPGDAKGLPAGSELLPADVRAAVNFCTGVDRARPQRSDEERARLAELLAVTGIEEGGLQEAMIQATFGLSDLVRDKKKLRGDLPVGNFGVDYGSPELNVAIQRVKPAAAAERKLAALDFRGGTGEAIVVSIHTSLDPRYFVENERDFEDLADPKALVVGLVEEEEPSHCGFTPAEELAAWRTLTGWAGGRRQPKARHFQRRCRKLTGEAEGPCRFVNKPSIDPLDSRIPARP